ncbi:MAG: aspartate/glutamate racemase family protein [Gammaproteobacteria bacterium]|nr:aspartate/glutamate racemase family protein [Gammaproteobacteria bacterium]MBU1440548.1 aspartate/glutamate racemase family protein [Gammaproteobacteria bacterium]MBU2286455.1 aspartate/glutamate racemase family protein [Gammaproteobacteria bacterium]
MLNLLVINPNTSPLVSTLLQTHVQKELGDAFDVQAVTARFGAPYIACEASYAVGQHAVLDAWAAAHAHGARPDVVLIGCFGDPGLLALRDGCNVPVGGLAEASILAAARLGRFAIVTGGERWAPMLRRIVPALAPEAAGALAGIHTLVPTGAELATDPDLARTLLAEACREAAARFQVDALILGGAGLAGIAADIADQVSVPLIDSVQAGARWAMDALQQRRTLGPSPPGFGVAWQNLSWELEALG